MGTRNLTGIEQKLRDRKWGLALYGKSREPKDLAEIIYRLLAKSEATVYLTPKGIKYHLEPGRARSIEDLFMIVKEYIPKISFKKLNDIALKLQAKHILLRWYCTTVRKQVHRVHTLLLTEEKVRSGMIEDNIVFKKS